MKTLTSLALLLTALTVVIDGNSPSKGQLQRSGQAQSVRRRGAISQPVRITQRGRKKSIWSYNPGHRSLAFLVAGEVDTVTPPPVEPGTGEYRCLGCCGDRVTIPGKSTAAPKLSNRVSRILQRSDGPGELGTEPNSINDRCLGCCEESVTPSPVTEERSTQRHLQRGAPTEPQRGAPTGPQRGATAGHQGPRQPQQRPQQPQQGPRQPQQGPRQPQQGPRQPQQGRVNKAPCIPPKCNPDWIYESSSSSEEMPAIRHHGARSRLQSVQLRSGNLCRHLGCRSALGLEIAPDSSSSSEED
ncbi:uncharacterized protein [Dendropsophus ebraccatus]|uniref:uncharacterized protein n=1 Tax=Dendropsophus ebraccatus TaxID=150705 RepID=UPI003831DEFD